jgi:peptidyl-prolyl cis-trans isomerase SurA
MPHSNVQPRMPRPRRRRAPARALAAALSLLALSAPSWPAAAQAAEPGESSSRILVDRVAAVVNDGIILYSDVMMRAAPMLADVQRIPDPAERERRRGDLESRVLDEMIAEELIVGAAEQAGVQITEQEVNAAIREIREQNNLSQEELEEALSMQGYSISAYREDLERQMLRMRASNMLVRPRVSVTDDDVRARYERMSRQTGSVSRVHLRHILIEVADDATEEERNAARDRAAELAQRARAGADFDELAREHSDDAATRDAGGDLGWIERGSLATEWEDIVFAMEESEVRGPITGPRGLHVFYIDGRETDEVPDFEEAAPDIREQIFQEEMERQTQSWIEELRRGAYVDIKLSS